ncbi:iron chaperone [Aestuariimicrobium ganziense]|uniref:iron chaperone n=1 Tax=Aestuariimicrobium ganziense TaxID=2773677 RepID=UPI001941DA5C|nr:DUF1801 domain-containing protein [Aestuariimicrobium ganziense]
MSTEAYLAGVPDAAQPRLEQLIALVRDELPGADETIAHAIPTFKVAGRSIVHLGGYARHCSIHPIPEGDEAYREAIAGYVAGRGTLRFRHDRELPVDLVRTTVRLLAER